MKDNVRKFYENFDFETMITDPPKLIQEFLDGETNFIKKQIVSNKKILEIGCGYGRLLGILSEKAKEVVGIDFSKRMVDLAKEKLSSKSNVFVKLMEADKLGFKDESFDYVVCLDNTFGNMPDIELDVLKEMARACKKGGCMIVSVFSENAEDVQFENYARIGLKNIKDDGNAIHTEEGFYSRRFSKDELVKLFEKIGLECKVIKICPVNYVAYAVKK